VIGIGGFGKVWKVHHKRSGRNFAVKEMSKSLVITKKSVHSVLNEKALLGHLNHPFLIEKKVIF
jgi:serum/glucocorticoid-regulated kinase 2